MNIPHFDASYFIEKIKKQKKELSVISKITKQISDNRQTPESEYLTNLVQEYLGVDINTPPENTEEIEKKLKERYEKSIKLLINDNFRSYMEQASAFNLYQKEVNKLSNLSNISKNQLHLLNIMQENAKNTMGPLTEQMTNISSEISNLNAITGEDKNKIFKNALHDNATLLSLYEGKTIISLEDFNIIQSLLQQTHIETSNKIFEEKLNIIKLDLAYLAYFTNIGEIKDDLITSKTSNIQLSTHHLSGAIEPLKNSVIKYTSSQIQSMDQKSHSSIPKSQQNNMN